MSYTKLTWADDEAPALSAANMNHIENGINDLYVLLNGLDRSGVEALIELISKISERANSENVTVSEIIRRIPYSNDGLPSSNDTSDNYSTLSGGSTS